MTQKDHNSISDNASTGTEDEPAPVKYFNRDAPYVPLPPFVTVGWLKSKLRLTPADQRKYLEALRKTGIPGIPEGRMDEEEFLEFLVEACQCPHVLVVAMVEAQKILRRTRKKRPSDIHVAVLISIYDFYYDEYDRKLTREFEGSDYSKQLVETLASDRQWMFLTELVWSCLIYRTDTDMMLKAIEDYPEVASRLGEFGEFASENPDFMDMTINFDDDADADSDGPGGTEKKSLSDVAGTVTHEAVMPILDGNPWGDLREAITELHAISEGLGDEVPNADGAQPLLEAISRVNDLMPRVNAQIDTNESEMLEQIHTVKDAIERAAQEAPSFEEAKPYVDALSDFSTEFEPGFSVVLISEIDDALEKIEQARQIAVSTTETHQEIAETLKSATSVAATLAAADAARPRLAEIAEKMSEATDLILAARKVFMTVEDYETAKAEGKLDLSAQAGAKESNEIDALAPTLDEEEDVPSPQPSGLGEVSEPEDIGEVEETAKPEDNTVEESEPEKPEPAPVTEAAAEEETETETEELSAGDEDADDIETNTDVIETGDAEDESAHSALAQHVDTAFKASLENGRFGLAYHIVRAADDIGHLDPPAPPFALEIFNVGRSLSSRTQAATQQILSLLQTHLDEIQNLTPDTSEAEQTAVAALVAGLIRPALFAPETGADTALGSLSLGSDLQFLNGLRELAQEAIRIDGNMTPAMLSDRFVASEWDSRMAEFYADFDDRYGDLKKVSYRSFDYQPAWAVWDSLFRDNGEIGSAMAAIAGRRTEKAEALCRKLLKTTATESPFDIMKRKDVEIRGSSSKKIEARAARKLTSAMQETFGIARDFIDLMESAPKQGQSSRKRDISAYRQRLHDQVKAIREHLGKEGLPGSWCVICTYLADDLEGIISGKSVRQLPVSWQHALHGDLLFIPGLRFGETWAPLDSADDGLLPRLFAAADAESQTLEQAYHDRCAENSHIASGRILDTLKRQGHPAKDVEDLRKLRDLDIKESREALRDQLSGLRKEIDQAMATDILQDVHASDLLTRLESINIDELPIEDFIAGVNFDSEIDSPEFETIADFPSGLFLLDQVRTSLIEAHAGIADDLTAQLDDIASLHPERADDVARVRDMIENRLFVAVSEYLDRLREGKPLPTTEIRNTEFARFFPGFVESVVGSAKSKATTVDHAIAMVGAGHDSDVLSFSHLEEKRRESASTMLTAWKRLKNPSGDKTRGIQTLMQALDFGVSRIEKSSHEPKSDRGQKFDVDTDIIAQRSTCCAPRFGSMAKGRYSVTIWRDTTTPEEIIQNLKPQDSRAQIVIFLGRMTAARRLDFMRGCREERKNCLLVDESLILFLSQQQGSRLSVLFDCTLPFTNIDPYVPSGDRIPPEIFFGRRDEIEKVLDPHGSCFIYGGRQLGKSVLLDYIEQMHGSPAEGRVICKIIIKPIGRGEPLESFWGKVSETLADNGIVKKRTTDADDIAGQIKSWLAANPDRQLFLLLDECDNFIEAETRSGFGNLESLKRLIEETDRKLRVVFAGLHNIQRSSTSPNTPLGNYGDPICIGPLYGKETTEGLRLVTEPLAALGFEFESPDLPLNILAQTNYYPSLAQLYCAELLKHLRADPAIRENLPPYKITAKMVQAAFESRELQGQIAGRFKLTLNLDKRYRAITLILTHKTLDLMRAGRIVEGFPASWIYRRALDFWERGFAGDTVQRFTVLLDELVSLGVLTTTGKDYRIRSINIAKMIGSFDQIETELLDFENEEPESEFDIQSFRRGITENGRILRSPLTPHQEYDLLNGSSRISIVFGTPALGIGNVVEFLKSADSRVDVDKPQVFPSIEVLLAKLSEEKRVSGKRKLYVVSQDSPWSGEWVRRLVRDRTFIRNERLRVLFLGDSQAAYGWLEEGRAATSSAKVSVHTLEPLSARSLQIWSRDAGLEPLGENGNRSRVLTATGGFSHYISEMETRLRGLPPEWSDLIDGWTADVLKDPEIDTKIGLLPQALPFLTSFIDCGASMSAKDLEALPEVTGIEFPMPVNNLVEWGVTIGILVPDRYDRWNINPLVGEIMQQQIIDQK